MGAEARAVRDDTEFTEAMRAVGTAFLDRPDDEQVAWRRRIFDRELDRVLIALEDDVVCGTARSFATPLTLPGGSEVVMAAVSGVGVLPTQRRRGHLTRLMELQLDDAAQRGEPLAGLIAAEWPIYGRYGYGSAIPAATYEVDTRLASFLDPTWHGSIELIDRPTFREVAPAVFDVHRRQTPGAIGRDDVWWDASYGDNRSPGSKEKGSEFRAIHRDASGDIDGYTTYRATGTWEHNVPTGRLDAQLVTTNPAVYADLWRFLCEVDWTSSVKVSPRSVDEPLPLLLVDGRAVVQTNRADHIWLRILDLPTVLTARSYRTSDRLVLDVTDDMGHANGRYALDASPDGAACSTTTDEPDLAMPVATLGAACVGGSPVTLLASAGLLDEHTAGATARFDALMSWSPAPFCSTNF